MAFYNRKQKEEKQIEFKNMTHDAKFNPMKKFYAVIKQGDKSYLTEYEAKFRSEAKIIFEEESRLTGGTLEYIGVYK